jgi:hypothetical protein
MSDDPIFVTVSMAEILLDQDMIEEAGKMVAQLLKREPNNSRVQALKVRLDGFTAGESIPRKPQGIDGISIENLESGLRMVWELTTSSLELVGRQVRYSGCNVIRLFTAAPGPRGVRTTTRDIQIEIPAGQLDLSGLPSPAVFVAAVGFLANTGTFVPLARSIVLAAAK